MQGCCGLGSLLLYNVRLNLIDQHSVRLRYGPLFGDYKDSAYGFFIIFYLYRYMKCVTLVSQEVRLWVLVRVVGFYS